MVVYFYKVWSYHIVWQSVNSFVWNCAGSEDVTDGQKDVILEGWVKTDYYHNCKVGLAIFQKMENKLL